MKLNKLQKKIGISFKDYKLLIQALTHKSFDTKNNYEKLEFLGDRVIGLIISKKLFIQIQLMNILVFNQK